MTRDEKLEALLAENAMLRAANVAARLQLALAFGETVEDIQIESGQPASCPPPSIFNIFKKGKHHGRTRTS